MINSKGGGKNLRWRILLFRVVKKLASIEDKFKRRDKEELG